MHMCTRQAERISGRFATPWGEGVVTVQEGRLAGVELPPVAGRGEAPGSGRLTLARDRVALARWVGELEAYFRGERLAWTAEEVPLAAMRIGPFARAVYSALLSVPPAVTVSYRDLAELAGVPRSARAVGNAMAANPVPIVVPCHRVIRSDGSLGNYGNNPAWKKRLLEHEREWAGDNGGAR